MTCSRDCKNPLFVPSNEWQRINKWVSGIHADEEACTREQRERLNRMQLESKEMTKSWPNSFENIQKRNEEKRSLRNKNTEEINMQFYENYCKQKKELEKKLRLYSEQRAFADSDGPKTFVSALVECEAQRERLAQEKFAENCRNERAKLCENDRVKLEEEAAKFHEENLIKAKAMRDANIKEKKFQLEQTKEIRNREEAEKNSLKKFQLEQIQKAKADLEEEKIRRKKQKENKKAALTADLNFSLALSKKKQQQACEEERLADEMAKLYQKEQDLRAAKLRDDKQKAWNERQKRLSLQWQNLKGHFDQKTQQEEQVYINGKNKLDELENKRFESDIQHFADSKKQRQEFREDYLKETQDQQHYEESLRKWEKLNRYKNLELTEKYKKDLVKDSKKQKEQYKNELFALWHERLQNDAQMIADRKRIFGKEAEDALRRDDIRVLKYANELLDECKRDGRPDYPLRRSIENYKRKRRLYPQAELKGSLKDNFPLYEPEDRTDFNNMPMFKPGPNDGFQMKEILKDPESLSLTLCDCIDQNRYESGGCGIQNHETKIQ